jgi:hypothetical protein
MKYIENYYAKQKLIDPNTPSSANNEENMQYLAGDQSMEQVMGQHQL